MLFDSIKNSCRINLFFKNPMWGQKMNCPRCRGNMVKEVFEDLRETGQFRFEGFRCPICGNIIDPVITQNRDPSRSRKGYRERLGRMLKQSHPARIPGKKSVVLASAKRKFRGAV